jgi:hypothetical protein
MPDFATDGVTRTVTNDGRVRIASGLHVALIARLAPGVLLVSERGTQRPETRAAMIRELEAEIAAIRPISVFIDARASDRMDAGGRDEWSAFGKRHKSEIQGVTVLVRSKLLEMAFSVMSMFLGGEAIRIVASEDVFLAEIQKKAPFVKGLPTVG